MLRCKEGDLVVILVGPYIGYFATTVKFLGEVEGVDPFGVSGTSKDCWEIYCKEISADIKAVQITCEDSYLQPIRPAPSGVTTETKKEITA